MCKVSKSIRFSQPLDPCPQFYHFINPPVTHTQKGVKSMGSDDTRGVHVLHAWMDHVRPAQMFAW